VYFLTYCLLVNTSLPMVMAVENPTSTTLPSGVLPGSTISTSDMVYDTVNPLDVRLDITQTDPTAIVNWNNFDIGSNGTVTFIQPDSAAAVLNRVHDGSVTGIIGSLEASGRVFVVNPAGVIFGEGASVNVAQLVASTLNISDSDFQAGHYEFSAVGDSLSEVINNGTITAADAVALIAKKVLNNGTIMTGEGGVVVMAAGDRVLLKKPGENILVDFEMDSVTIPDEGDTEGFGDVTNEGEIDAPAGEVVLAAGDIYSTALRVFGGTGKVEQNGEIDVDAATDDAGTVILTAADEVSVGPESVITANAMVDGDGGEIIVYTPGTASSSPDAQYQALGNGVIDLDGDGFIDPEDTDLRGSVEFTGSYLTPPVDVDLAALSGEPDDAGMLSVGPPTGDLLIADGAMPTSPAQNTLYEEYIELISQQGTNLDMFSHGDIFVEAMTDGVIEGRTGDITFRNVFDTGGITFESDGPDVLPSTTVKTSTGGDIFMLAGSGGLYTGDIETDTSTSGGIGNPGRIRLFTNNGGDIETGHLTVNGGNFVEVSVISAGDLTIHGDVVSQTQEVPDPEDKTSNAQICLVAAEDVDITGSVIVYAHGKIETRSNIHIDAGVGPDPEEGPDTTGTITVDLGGSGQIYAEAKTSGPNPDQPSEDPLVAEATIKLHAGAETAPDDSDAIKVIGGKSGGSQAVQVKANVQGKPGYSFTWEDEPLDRQDTGEGYDVHAQIEIESDYGDEPDEICPECPPPLFIPPPVPPIANPDFGTAHLNNAVSGNVLGNDTPPEPGVELMAELVSGPQYGDLEFDGESGDYTYTPADGFVGTDTFTYIALDGGQSAPTIVTITITNDLPEAGAGALGTLHMNNASDPINLNDLVSDLNGDELTIEIVTEPSHGTLEFDEQTDTYTYQPDEGYVGPDSFIYRVTDGERVEVGGDFVYVPGSAEGTMTNALPVANDGTAEGFSNNPIPGTLDFYDTPDGGYIDPLTVVLVGAVDGVLTTPSGGTVTLTNGSFVYLPPDGFVGEDNFTYAVTDGQLEDGLPIFVEGGVTVIVSPTPPPPEVLPAAPLPDMIVWEVGGCPTLMEWLADELGVEPENVQHYGLHGVSDSQNAVGTKTSIAYKGDIQWCLACSKLKDSVQVLTDPNGAGAAILAQVIDPLMPSNGTPPSPEQLDVIAVALKAAAEDTQYASAQEFVDAVVTYVTTLTDELGWDPADAIALFMENHGAPITEDESVSLYIGALLTNIRASLESTGG
jgi:filamentous hemagglutinin family protein